MVCCQCLSESGAPFHRVRKPTLIWLPVLQEMDPNKRSGITLEGKADYERAFDEKVSLPVSCVAHVWRVPAFADAPRRLLTRLLIRDRR